MLTRQFLDKLPDLSKSFEKQLSSLKQTIGPEGNDVRFSRHASLIAQVVDKAYRQLKDIASSKGSAKETLSKAQKVVDETVQRLKELAKDKTGDLSAGLKSKGAEALQALPGMDKVPELAELSKLLSERGPEAEKILRSTVDDVRKVLRQRCAALFVAALTSRLDEGKKLGEDTAAEAKKRA